MDDFSLRPAADGDRRALLDIWRLSFGDSEEYIEGFMSRFLSPDSCVVASVRGEAVSAMHALGGLELLSPGEGPLRAVYLYALGTLPGHRRLGCGAAVTGELARRAYEGGADVVCVMPAQESLRRWYEKRLGAVSLSYTRSGRPALARRLVEPDIRPLSAAEYSRLRERILEKTAHIRFPLPLLEWYGELLSAGGGGFFSVSGAAAAVEKNGAFLSVRELLAPSGELGGCAGALMRRLGADDVLVRAPEGFPGTESLERTDGVALLPGAGTHPRGVYWGFFFD